MSEPNLPVLSVSPLRQDHTELLQSLANSPWLVFEASSHRSALSILKQNRISVVVCACESHEENWRGLLQQIARTPEPPYLIVASRNADESMWGEVLDAGAYDLLAKPFHPAELQRTLAQAWVRWQQQFSSRDVPQRARAATA
jgi:DNA-binding NtrC family response regulator